MDLQSHRFLSYFEPPQAAELCQLAILERFAPQAVIFEESEIPDSLYLVLEGEVEFSKRIGPQQYQTIALASPDEFFGEFGVLDGQPRSARAIACGPVTLAKIPRDQLMDILDRSPGRVVLKLFGHIIQYLRYTTERYVSQIVHKQKMALVGEMVNTIVHDFKSPFTGIQLSSSMLKEMHPDEETAEWCDLIQAQVMRMSAMAEEVLEFTKGSTVLVKKPLRLSEIIQRFQKLNNVYFSNAKVDFVVEVEDAIIAADENKLMRVWQNIVGNAVDAFENQGGRVSNAVRRRVSIAAVTKDEWVEIKIADNGPGIPEAIRDRLFEPFVTFGKRSGTGLGTAIAKSIIDAHGGQIWFESSAESGTTFYIILPLFQESTPISNPID
ncbi:ATP-binding protein [[Phormidium] sp. ETS-05]|uniref:ATP-binding protein n=1 Tax=[Phormidium] sp. ETS-05 TaxID=222819 RepID=UPI0018EF2D08|nr:ATP-binding protein [[Phormidium] sp. ETS-05]